MTTLDPGSFPALQRHAGWRALAWFPCALITTVATPALALVASISLGGATLANWIAGGAAVILLPVCMTSWRLMGTNARTSGSSDEGLRWRFETRWPVGVAEHKSRRARRVLRVAVTWAATMLVLATMSGLAGYPDFVETTPMAVVVIVVVGWGGLISLAITWAWIPLYFGRRNLLLASREYAAIRAELGDPLPGQ